MTTRGNRLSKAARLSREVACELEEAVTNVIDDAYERYKQLYAEDAGASELPSPESFEASWYRALFPQTSVDREAPRTFEEAAPDWQRVAELQQFHFKQKVSKRR